MPPIRRIREPLDPIIADTGEESQDPGDHPNHSHNHRSGNQNARTHGIYSADPPDLDIARTRIHEDTLSAMKRGDHRALIRIARTAAAIGDTNLAAALRVQARAIKDTHTRKQGQSVPIRRPRLSTILPALKRYTQEVTASHHNSHRTASEQLADFEERHHL